MLFRKCVVVSLSNIAERDSITEEALRKAQVYVMEKTITAFPTHISRVRSWLHRLHNKRSLRLLINLSSDYIIANPTL